MNKNYSKEIIGIACLAANRSIGYQNNLIYSIKKELLNFKKITLHTDISLMTNAVVMGRKTFDSLPKILPNRLNCVITKGQIDSNKQIDNLKYFNSIESCLNYLDNNVQIEKIFIIGGESIYKQCFEKNYYSKLILTIINSKIDYGDTFFPYFNLNNYKLTINDKYCNIDAIRLKDKTNIKLDYAVYYLENKDSIDINENSLLYKMFNREENQYLDILRKVYKNGNFRSTRNANTISKFGVKMSFDINEHFPLLTTKKVYWKGVLKELLWFIKGETDSKKLYDEGVRIWDGNSSREFLDNIGLTQNREGDCGPIYGFQWRHFNAEYIGPDKDYSGQGIDQLQNIIDLIKENPMSRRMYLTAWNPCQLNEMALPPCHISYQFYVNIDRETRQKKLSCMMYQRSGDLFLGVPFNIASTAALTYIIANITDCKPDTINIVIGDAHIYENHIEQVKTQLLRQPKSFPKLMIDKKFNNLDDIDYSNFSIKEYKCHPTIRAKMVA